MKAELINGQRIKCYSNKKYADCFTVCYLDMPEKPEKYEMVACVCMNETPFHPQGIGIHSSAIAGKHLGKEIKFKDLPDDCQKLVMQDLNSVKSNKE